MSDCIFRVEVGCATNRVKKWFLGRDEYKYKYRFRVLQAPSLQNASNWGKPVKLGIPKDQLRYLRFDFPTEKSLREMGEKLAQIVFDQDTLIAYRDSLAYAGQKDQRLRLMFSYEPGLDHLVTNIPWECLFDKVKGGSEHFGLSQYLSVSRFISRFNIQPKSIADRLVVMAVVPAPQNGCEALDVAAELAAMEEVVKHHSGKIHFHPIPNAQWGQFTDDLPKVNPHVLIYSGHSQFINDEPHFLFQKANGDCDPRRMSELEGALRAQLQLDPDLNLRVVVLSACETAYSKSEHPFGSAAARLIQLGVPAVIAMQSKVHEEAAREFDLQFFNYLFEQHSIDTCVNAGRAAMLDVERDYDRQGTQWAVPALYISTLTDSLFDFSASTNVSLEREQNRRIMQTQFRRVTKRFIKRKELYEQSELQFPDDGVTIVYGEFGAGKTQLISALCTAMIDAPATSDGNEPLCFYVRCNKSWTTLGDVLGALDKQAQSLGFKGFRIILSQSPSGDDENVMRQLCGTLALRRLVIVFDDYLWDEVFWRYLFEQLAAHLRRSKVYVITSSDEYKFVDEDYYKEIRVPGFTPEEAEEFFTTAEKLQPEVLEPMMAVAARANYLPWYLKIIKHVFRGEPGSPVASDQYIVEIDKRLSEAERSVLKQLSLLRQPVTLSNLATMLDGAESARFLDAAYSLQRKSILTFTHDLGVELSVRLKDYYRMQMSAEERDALHAQAAAFYEERSRVAL